MDNSQLTSQESPGAAEIPPGETADLAARLQERLECNLAAFKVHDPALFERFAHYTPISAVELLPAENGAFNLRWVTSKELLYPDAAVQKCSEEHIEHELSCRALEFPPFNHCEDPIGQIQYRYQLECMALIDEARPVELKAAEVNLIPNLVMVGSGLGYAVAALYARVEVFNTVLVEPDPDVFYASLHCFDWASLLNFLHHNGSSLKVVIAEAVPEICAQLQTHYIEQGLFLAFAHCFVTGDPRTRLPALKDALEHDYQNLHAQMGFFDDNLFGLSHGLNAIVNHAHFVRQDAVLPTPLPQMPVFIVGNGPSLDHDLPFLRRHQDQALIIACGSALDTLYHAGIQPDFYACTERTPQIAQTVEYLPDKEFLAKITLLAGEVVHPDTLRLFTHNALFVKEAEVLRWLLKDLAFKPILHMNPLVGNMGLSSALSLGFKNLFLFGLDCGRRVGSEAHHSRGSQFYYGQAASRDYIELFPYRNTRPGNFGELCECGDVFVLGLLTMEQALREHQGEVKCHNCSDGARIAGAVPLHSEELDTTHWPALDKIQLCKTIARDLTFEVALDEQELTKRCAHQSFNELCAALKDMWQNAPRSRLECLRVMQQSCALMNRLDLGGFEFINQLLRGSLEFFFMLILRALYVVPDERDGVQLALRLVALYQHFLTDACAIYRFVPHYEMGAHQQLCGGRVGADYPDSKAPAMPQLVRLVAEDYEDPQRHFVKRYD